MQVSDNEFLKFSRVFSIVSNTLNKIDNGQIEEKTKKAIDEYVNLLSSIDKKYYEEYSIEKQKVIDDIKKVKKILIAAIRYFHKGDIFKAVAEVNKLFDYIDKEEIESGHIFYRARSTNTNYLYKKKEMFHIPLNERCLVRNQRYSLSGFPCLYLGEKSYTCWEELERPDFGLCNFVSLENTEPLKILNLSFPAEITTHNQLVSISIIMACSLKTDKSNDFKAEYIISQLILHNLIKRRNDLSKKDTPIIGLKYCSIAAYNFNDRIFPFPGELPQSDLDKYLNYVIPVMGIAKEICPKLCKLFKMSSSISYNNITFHRSKNCHPLPSGDDWFKSNYGNSYFHEIDELLSDAEKNAPNIESPLVKQLGMIPGEIYMTSSQSGFSAELPTK